MGFMRVFRFIFMGIGLFFTFIGTLLYLAFTNPNNDFLASIAEANPDYDEKAGLVFLAIGGILLFLSILFFVIYGIKGKAWYQARLEASERRNGASSSYRPSSSRSSSNGLDRSIPGIAKYKRNDSYLLVLDDGKTRVNGTPTIIRALNGKNSIYCAKGQSKPGITLLVVKDANMAYAYDNGVDKDFTYPLVSLIREEAGSDKGVIIVSNRQVKPSTDFDAISKAVKHLSDSYAIGLKKYEECAGAIKFAWPIDSGIKSLERKILANDRKMLEELDSYGGVKLFEEEVISMLEISMAKEYLKQIFAKLY